MLKKSYMSLLSATIFISACDTANEKTFKEVIQHSIDTHKPDIMFCASSSEDKEFKFSGGRIKEFLESIKSEEIIPVEVMSKLKNNIDQYVFFFKNGDPIPNEQEQALINSGLINKLTYNNKTVYITTAVGSQYVYNDKKEKHTLFICSKGKYIVKEIIDFSIPSDFFGKTISHVNYSVGLKFNDPWMENEEVKRAFKPTFDKFLRRFKCNVYYNDSMCVSSDEKYFRDLILTNKGWKA